MTKIVAHDGPYYLTFTEGRTQPWTLRRTARWRNDYHRAHFTTIAFYATEAEAHAGLSAWVARTEALAP